MLQLGSRLFVDQAMYRLHLVGHLDRFRSSLRSRSVVLSIRRDTKAD
jgi:hypothetical protein